MDSILTSIKKLLGITEDYKQFDTDIIIHINSVFMILTQLGVGPSSGFRISDEFANWSDFLPENKNLESVKDYVYLKVRLLFDPPASSAVLESFKALANELEWRIKVEAETKSSTGEEEIQNGE